MKKTVYVVNNDVNYNYIMNKIIKQEKQTQFTIKETNYTKTVITPHMNYLFNSDGKEDKKLLLLINLVKSDSKKYLKNNNVPLLSENLVKWYYFNDFTFKNTKDKNFEGWQMDLNSAYWNLAIKNKIVQQKTFDKWDFFTKDMNIKDRKAMRLRALGTLATVKRVTEYKDGVFTEQEPEYNLKTRNLYLNICNSISEIMLEIQKACNIPYFYWDMFVLNDYNQVQKVDKILKGYGLEASIKSDNFTIVKSENHNFIYSELKNHSYPIKNSEVIYS